ncbi:MAG: DUF6495 family protein [Bacteroidota bacterium]
MSDLRYRPLRRDELEEVQPQFIRFLAANGLPGPDWEKIKAEDPPRAEQLIHEFSQVIFGATLERIEYLIERRPKDLRTYRCGPDNIEMNGLRIEGDTRLDLSDSSLPPDQMMQQLRQDQAKVQLYSGQRAYRPYPAATNGTSQAPDRSYDLYRLMEGGALISDGELFQLLEGLKG